MKKRKNGKFKIRLKYWWRNIKKWTKKIVSFCLNPRMVLCFGIAWVITNGWCYAFIAIGGWLGINWMLAVGTAYAAFLWFPFTPEKLITIIISLFLLKRLFPNDEKTLKVLQKELDKLKAAIKRKKTEIKEKKEEKKKARKE